MTPTQRSEEDETEKLRALAQERNVRKRELAVQKEDEGEVVFPYAATNDMENLQLPPVSN